jgi:hypothetical protein
MLSKTLIAPVTLLLALAAAPSMADEGDSGDRPNDGIVSSEFVNTQPQSSEPSGESREGETSTPAE